MPEQKIFQCIDALDGERISIIRRDEPLIILLDEVMASFCSPSVNGVIGVIVSTHSLRTGPDGWNFCLERVISRYSCKPDVVDDTRDCGC